MSQRGEARCCLAIDRRWSSPSRITLACSTVLQRSRNTHCSCSSARRRQAPSRSVLLCLGLSLTLPQPHSQVRLWLPAPSLPGGTHIRTKARTRCFLDKGGGGLAAMEQWISGYQMPPCYRQPSPRLTQYTTPPFGLQGGGITRGGGTLFIHSRFIIRALCMYFPPIPPFQ